MNEPILTFKVSADAIIETVEMVAYGLSSAPPPTGQVLIPDTLFQLTNAQLGKPAITKAEFDQRILDTAFRRFIEDFSGFLEDAGIAASLVHRAKDSSYELDVGAEKTRINKLPFPNKITHIANKIGRDIDQRDKDNVLSINKARNCFEHGHGVVRNSDLDSATASVMTVKWTGWDADLLDASGAVIREVTRMPVDIPPLGELAIKSVQRSKSFALGSHIMFDSKEITEIGFTLVTLGAKYLTLLGESTNG